MYVYFFLQHYILNYFQIKFTACKNFEKVGDSDIFFFLYSALKNSLKYEDLLRSKIK